MKPRAGGLVIFVLGLLLCVVFSECRSFHTSSVTPSVKTGKRSSAQTESARMIHAATALKAKLKVQFSLVQQALRPLEKRLDSSLTALQLATNSALTSIDATISALNGVSGRAKMNLEDAASELADSLDHAMANILDAWSDIRDVYSSKMAHVDEEVSFTVDEMTESSKEPGISSAKSLVWGQAQALSLSFDSELTDMEKEVKAKQATLNDALLALVSTTKSGMAEISKCTKGLHEDAAVTLLTHMLRDSQSLISGRAVACKGHMRDIADTLAQLSDALRATFDSSHEYLEDASRLN